MPTDRSTSRDKVRAHRTRLRKAGLRPVQIWVPDPAVEVLRSGRTSSVAAGGKSPHAKRDQEFVDAISAWNAE